MKRLLLFLFVLLGASFSTTLMSDWLQDISNQAKQGLSNPIDPTCRPPECSQPGSTRPPPPRNLPGVPSASGPMATVKWYVNCDSSGTDSYHRNNGVVRVGMPPFAYPNYKHMAGPYQSDALARNWVARNCASWRCNWNGACVGAAQVGPQCPSGYVFQDGLFGSGQCVPQYR